MIKDPEGLISEERLEEPNIYILLGWVIKEAEKAGLTS